MIRDEAAVSNVVSAVLVFTLFATVGMIYTFETLPQQVEAREANHQQAVVAHMAALKAGLEGAESGAEGGSTSRTIQLGAKPIPLLQTTPSSGTLSIESDVSLDASFTTPRIHLLDEQPLGVPSEPVDGDVMSEVQTVRSLQLALSTSGIGANGDASVQVQASDGTETATATLRHVGRIGALTCAEDEVRLEITGTLGTRTHTLLCNTGGGITDYTIDLLGTDAGFGAYLARLNQPLTLTATDNSGAGSLLAVWVDTSSRTQTLGSGIVGTYQISESGARVSYDPDYRELENQAVHLELGAIVRSQDTTSTIHTFPSFRIIKDGSWAHLRWDVTFLSGAGSISGTQSATVDATHDASSRVLLDTRTGTFTVTSPNAQAWRDYFADQSILLGLPNALQVSGADDTAIITFGQGDGITAWRMQLTETTAMVNLQ